LVHRAAPLRQDVHSFPTRRSSDLGDSTNVHIMYPGLVYGFIHFLKANRASEGSFAVPDVSIDAAGAPVSSVQRYHDVLLGLAGRDRKSTRLNSSHSQISYAACCLN